MTFTADTIVSRSGNTLSTEIDGEMVLVGIETGRYYGFDAIGTAIWKRIEQPCRVDALCAALVADFDGDPALIERETQTFLTQELIGPGGLPSMGGRGGPAVRRPQTGPAHGRSASTCRAGSPPAPQGWPGSFRRGR